MRMECLHSTVFFQGPKPLPELWSPSLALTQYGCQLMDPARLFTP